MATWRIFCFSSAAVFATQSLIGFGWPSYGIVLSPLLLLVGGFLLGTGIGLMWATDGRQEGSRT